MKPRVAIVLGVTSLSSPALAAGPAQTEKADPWAELIHAGQQEELIVSRTERDLKNQIRNRSLSARKARGLAGVIYGGFGFNALLFESPFVEYTRYGTYGHTDRFLGGLFTVGAGLRLPLSLHWDLQSRAVLGISAGNYDLAANHTLFSLNGDVTFRARASGISGRAGYFGMGVMAGGQFAFVNEGSEVGTMAKGFAGGILEAGGMWGSKEQWDLGLRWSLAGGNYFMSEVSLVFGGMIGHTKQESERQRPAE